jgi:hypothetical protein
VRGTSPRYDIKTGKMVVAGYSTGPDSEMLIDPNTTTTWTDGKVQPVGATLAEDLEGRPVEDRRRHHLGLVQLRPGPQPDVLRHGNPARGTRRSARATTSGR